ncbi:MAG: hypothetical protein Q8O55_04660 [Dehalococcoidales bacterium]|nr:hypothetical protein [Dehalococcoidales bacterium]
MLGGVLKKLRYREDLGGVVLNAPAAIEKELAGAGLATALEGSSRFTVLFVRN